MQGYVRWYNEQKRYGFIRNESGDWFFHKDNVIGEVRRADDVECWLAEGRRGELVAVEVRRLS